MKIEVNLPVNSCNDFTEHQIKIILASALYDKGVTTLGYAAESVGFGKRELIEEMGEYGVPVVKMTADEVKMTVDNAKKKKKKNK
jgi:predicted HTH domain antitoxin